MLVTAWSNGSPLATGAGYGLRIDISDRDRHFETHWNRIEVDLDGDATASISLSESFWNLCAELRSAQVGRWLLKRKLAPLPKGDPPKLMLQPTTTGRFRLTTVELRAHLKGKLDD